MTAREERELMGYESTDYGEVLECNSESFRVETEAPDGSLEGNSASFCVQTEATGGYLEGNSESFRVETETANGCGGCRSETALKVELAAVDSDRINVDGCGEDVQKGDVSALGRSRGAEFADELCHDGRSVFGVRAEVHAESDPCAPISHISALASSVVSCGGVGPLGGCRGSSGRGLGSRSSLCCPGCGLWWSGGLCSVCNVRFGDRDTLNSCMDHGGNSCIPNLRMVRTQDIQGEERSKRLEVGSLIVCNTPEGARLANYLRWAP